MARDILRKCIFRPYLKGPTFNLTMYATTRTDSRGQTIIGYELRQGRAIIFAGEDFAGSPMHADDSDATVASLMTFLCLRPGDTDADYFSGYTPAQLQFCRQHAENVSLYVATHFES